MAANFSWMSFLLMTFDEQKESSCALLGILESPILEVQYLVTIIMLIFLCMRLGSLQECRDLLGLSQPELFVVDNQVDTMLQSCLFFPNTICSVELENFESSDKLFFQTFI